MSSDNRTIAKGVIPVRFLRSLILAITSVGILRAGIAVLLFLTGTLSVTAHPHVFVEARSKLVFDDSGMAIAVEQVFRFDDAFSAFAVQGFDTNGDGAYSREELGELAKVNVESMGDYGYFTFGDNTRVEFDFKTPTDYWLELSTVPLKDYWAMKPEDIEAMEEDARMNGSTMPESVELLELHFTLPLKDASDARNVITLDVYDPTYYVDFRFGREETAIGTVNAPGVCRVTRKEPPPLDDATAYALAQIGADQRDLPPELQAAADTQVNQMIVDCTGAPAAPAAASVPEDGQKAIAEALSKPVQNSLQTQANAATDAAGPGASEASEPAPTVKSPSGASAPGAVQPGVLDRVFGTIAAKQKEFYQALVASLRAFRANPNAMWLMIGLSFAYGIFHAAGPGHGKAIITSYVIANNETLKKGIVLSFASAFAQAVTAIVLVGGLAVLFGLTSLAIQDTADGLEIGSYALIAGLGGWLLWQKTGRPLLAAASRNLSGGQLAYAGAHGQGHSHDHAHHGHDHHHGHEGYHHHHHDIGEDGVCSTCGHAHAPTPDMLQGRITLARAASIVLAVGLRPCTGALVVLVFALSQGMIAAGIVSTLAMAVGTGITVSLLAGLAVGAKDLAVRLFGEGSPMAGRIHRTIEIAGAMIVLLLGLTLLIAKLGWG